VQCLRQRSQLAPKNVKYAKRHKGKIPIPIGGSIKGTTLAFGEYGIRVRGNGGRLSADHLTVAEDAIKRQLKPVKGAKIYMRVFPNIPVSVKVGQLVIIVVLFVTWLQGNETRMGKGKGPFEYWAVRLVLSLEEQRQLELIVVQSANRTGAV
jgi:ribosomal protein L16